MLTVANTSKLFLALLTAMSCRITAQIFVQSYASAMHTAQSPDATSTSCATALASHYLPGMTRYTFGHKHCFETQADSVAGIKAHLEAFERSGLGYDIRLRRSSVESLSSHSAICWLTWGITPKNGAVGWSWQNVYGYRLGQGGEEGWEFVVTDNELAGVMQRAPKEFLVMAAGSRGE